MSITSEIVTVAVGVGVPLTAFIREKLKQSSDATIRRQTQHDRDVLLKDQERVRNEKLDMIISQVIPNGGHNLCDRVEGLHSTLDQFKGEVRTRLDGIDKRLASGDITLAKFEERLRR